jgi:hypothetical protein
MREASFDAPESRLFYKYQEAESSLGRLGLHGAAAGETIESITVPEIDDELKSTYKDRPEGVVFLGCGDDRDCSTESSLHLRSEIEKTGIYVPTEAYLRIFGGIYGLSWNALVTADVQAGRAAGRNFDMEDYLEFSRFLAVRASQLNQVIATQHSATAQEMGPVLKPDIEDPVGCAYAHGKGEIAYIAGYEPNVQRVSQQEWVGLGGQIKDRDEDRKFQAATRQVAHSCFGDDPRSFSVSRGDFTKMGTPTMVLRGEHADPEQTLVVANFTLDKLSVPHAAHDIGRPYYGVDVTQSAELIMKSLPELNLDPEILVRSILRDSCATRGALAGGDPTKLRLARYGDMQTALEYLKAVKR